MTGLEDGGWHPACQWCAGLGCKSCGGTGLRQPDLMPVDPRLLLNVLVDAAMLMEAAFRLTTGRTPDWIEVQGPNVASDVGTMSVASFLNHYATVGRRAT